PVLQQARSLGRDFPVSRGFQCAPAVDLGAHAVDDRRVVLLRLRGEAFVEEQCALLRGALLFSRSRDRRDELGAAAALDDSLRRLSRFVELPMTLRILVRRVEDGPLEEGFGHRVWPPGSWGGV